MLHGRAVPARFLSTVGLMVLILIGGTRPAYAHGTGGSDVSNYLSSVTGVQALDSAGKPAGSAELPIVWRVVGNDALLEVENKSGRELTVFGYEGEPYLRISAEGVWANRNSESTYLNADRYAQTSVPEFVSSTAEPDWMRVGDGPGFAWHDHRVHWMSLSLPPAVTAAGQDVQSSVFDWRVPFALGDQQAAVEGRLQWVPAPAAWPWLLGGLAVAGLPLAAALLRPGGPDRRAALRRLSAALLGAIIVMGIVHGVDDVTAVPATAAENIGEAAKSGAFVVLGVLGVLWAWRGWHFTAESERASMTIGPATGLIVAAVALGLWFGVGHMFTLLRSQIASGLPEAFSRGLVGLSLMAVLPVGLAAWLVHRGAPTGAGGVQADGSQA
ncbi:MAG: hypothetical protein ACRD0D_08905 [Acidimicrobiales bacterium]